MKYCPVCGCRMFDRVYGTYNGFVLVYQCYTCGYEQEMDEISYNHDIKNIKVTEG